MDNFKEDYSNTDEPVSTPPVPPTSEGISKKEKKAMAKADKAQKKAEKKAAKAQRPFYKKWWFWVIVLVLLVAMNGKGKNSQQDEYPPQIPSEQTAQVESQQNLQSENIAPSTQEEFEDALKRAQIFSDEMHTSKEQLYELMVKFNSPEATEYAINHIAVDFNQNALDEALWLIETDYTSKAEIQEELEYARFTSEEVQYAMNHLNDIDFNQVALKAASFYLESLHQNKEEIYTSLTEKELFTPEEAQYAIDHLDD